MQKLILLLGLVIVIGAGAHLYIMNLASEEQPSTTTADESTTADASEPLNEDVAVTENIVTDETVSESVPEQTTSADVSTTPTTASDPTPVSTEPAVNNAPDLDNTLVELETTFDVDYDDSSLDAEFEDNLDQSYEN